MITSFRVKFYHSSALNKTYPTLKKMKFHMTLNPNTQTCYLSPCVVFSYGLTYDDGKTPSQQPSLPFMNPSPLSFNRDIISPVWIVSSSSDLS